MVQQRNIVNQRLQLRLQVDYETSPRGGIYIQQRVFPQQRIKKKNSGSIFDIALKRWAITRCTRLSADQPVSPVRFDLILALFICFGYLDARIDERLNMAILLRFSHIRTSPDCSGYNQCGLRNPVHHVSGVPKTGVVRLWIPFFDVLIRSSNRYGVSPDRIVL